MCIIAATLIPFAGYEITGSCGERIMVGVNELITPDRIPDGACPEYRARVLATFSAGGPRTLERPIHWPPRPGEDWPDGMAERLYFHESMIGTPRRPSGSF